jgi:hypothetical protein
MVLAYLLSVVAALVVLAVALRPRRAPRPAPAPGTVAAPCDDMQAEIHLILTAAIRLAERLAPAA